MKQISVVVIDDHPLFRQGVVEALSLEPDIEVVGQAANGDDGMTILRALAPNVAVVDINLPGLNGQQITRNLVAEKIPVRIVLLTGYDDIEQAIHAIRSGANAYSSKNVLPEHLMNVVRSVHANKFVVGEETFDAHGIETWLQTKMEEVERPYSTPGEPFHPLSTREMEVLSCVTQGQSNKEIAAILGISHQTVKNHVTAILRKLGVEDRTQAAVYALRHGWVRLQEQKKP
ncbi:MAG TPA: response regulator transcription factor [Anaerolineales bacterium]|nr:response regulator transcription factor [Anaerolineales bacterium]